MDNSYSSCKLTRVREQAALQSILQAPADQAAIVTLGEQGITRRRRDRHSADTPSPTLLGRLLVGEGAAE